MHSPCSERERDHKKETPLLRDKSENQWDKNDVAQFTEQINQKTNPTRKM